MQHRNFLVCGSCGTAASYSSPCVTGARDVPSPLLPAAAALGIGGHTCRVNRRLPVVVVTLEDVATPSAGEATSHQHLPEYGRHHVAPERTGTGISRHTAVLLNRGTWDPHHLAWAATTVHSVLTNRGRNAWKQTFHFNRLFQ